MSFYMYFILAQVKQSRQQLIEYLTWKDGHNDDSLQYVEKLEVDKKKLLLSGIVESIVQTYVTYVGEKRYSIDILVRTFEYFALSQSTYNHLRQDFQLPSISTMTKMTSKQKQFYNSSFSSLAMIISDMCNFGFERFMMMQTFSCKLYSPRLRC